MNNLIRDCTLMVELGTLLTTYLRNVIDLILKDYILPPKPSTIKTISKKTPQLKIYFFYHKIIFFLNIEHNIL